MALITAIKAREVLTSRGTPTVEVEVHTATGYSRAIVPSGASTGQFEALELLDGDSTRYNGKGVLRACSHVQDIIAPALIGQDVSQQSHIDTLLCTLDGTDNKSRLGANAILGVSMACLQEAARSSGTPLYSTIATLYGTPLEYVAPRLMMNVINGGVHADSGLTIQEFMIVPQVDSVRTAVRMGAEVIHHLKQLLEKAGESTSVGDEGGFAPRLASHEAALDMICQAIEAAHYRPGQDIALAIDAAASEFYRDGHYHLLHHGTMEALTPSQLCDYYQELTTKYPLISIEDSHEETDHLGFAQLQQQLGATHQLVGDDLYVTNPIRIQEGIEKQLTNSVLIKMNQIGTITETLEAIRTTKGANWTTVISHRSGETEDTTIADLCIGTQAGQIKTGSLRRSERVAKYNQLMRIEEELVK